MKLLICRGVHRVTDFEKISSLSLQGWSSNAFASFGAGDLVLCSTLSVCFFSVFFPSSLCFVSFVWPYVRSMAFRSVFAVKVVHNWHWHQGACLFTFGCFCWCVGLPFLLLGLPFYFVIISLQVACPLPVLGFGVGLVTVSRLILCLFVCPMLCCVYFPMGERC